MYKKDEKKQKEASIGPDIKNDVHNEHLYHLTELNWIIKQIYNFTNWFHFIDI